MGLSPYTAHKPISETVNVKVIAGDGIRTESIEVYIETCVQTKAFGDNQPMREVAPPHKESIMEITPLHIQLFLHLRR